MSPSICGLVSFISSEKLSAIIFRIFFCPILLLLSFLHLRYHMTDLHTEFSVSITSLFYIFPFVSLCFLLNIFFQNIFQFTKSLYQCLVCCLKILSFFFFFLVALVLCCCMQASSSDKWSHSSLPCTGFSPWCVLLSQGTGSRCVGLSSCSRQTWGLWCVALGHSGFRVEAHRLSSC